MSEKSLDNLIAVCNRYKQNEFGLLEFESRISTAAIAPLSVSRSANGFARVLSECEQ